MQKAVRATRNHQTTQQLNGKGGMAVTGSLQGGMLSHKLKDPFSLPNNQYAHKLNNLLQKDPVHRPASKSMVRLIHAHSIYSQLEGPVARADFEAARATKLHPPESRQGGNNNSSSMS